MFKALKNEFGELPIIAEDLGFLTDSVRKLLRDVGYPGMKVLQFAFDRRDPSGIDYLPHNFIENCVAYAGTHDNDTIIGWFQEAANDDTMYAREYLHITDDIDLNWKMLDALWESVANLTVVQAQDLLGLGREARMNEPSTVGKNWQWRAKPGVFTKELADKIYEKMRLYNRLG